MYATSLPSTSRPSLVIYLSVPGCPFCWAHNANELQLAGHQSSMGRTCASMAGLCSQTASICWVPSSPTATFSRAEYPATSPRLIPTYVGQVRPGGVDGVWRHAQGNDQCTGHGWVRAQKTIVQRAPHRYGRCYLRTVGRGDRARRDPGACCTVYVPPSVEHQTR